MSTLLRVALIGFSAFERNTLATCFKLGRQREPAYTLADGLDNCDLVLADADIAGPAQAVAAARRIADTVFVGHHPPQGVPVRALRPIDALQVMRELDALAALRPSRPTVPSPAPRVAPRALLVDDSEIALRFLETRLQALGLETERALGSEQALERLAAARFDFAFLDVELGPASAMDGLVLCQHIRRHAAADGRLPVLVMVSAHQAQLDRARGTLAGCDAYLGKPLEHDALVALLRRHGARVAQTRS